MSSDWKLAGVMVLAIGSTIWAWHCGLGVGRAEQEAKDKANAPKGNSEIAFDAPAPDRRGFLSVCPQVLPNFNGGDTSKTDFDKVIKENNDARREADKSMSGVLAAAEQLDKSIDHLGASLGLCWSKSKETWISCPSGKPHKAAPKGPLKCTDEYGVVYNCADGRPIHPTDDTLIPEKQPPCPSMPPKGIQYAIPPCSELPVTREKQPSGTEFDHCNGHLDPIGPSPQKGDDVDMDPVNCTIKVRVPKAEDQ